MASSHSIISPFPSDIDRDAFGYWLSGFTDGEGHFKLQSHPTARHFHAYAGLMIGLRDDDRPILEQIQSFWQCGLIHQKNKINHGKPQASFQVTRLADLMDIIIPHFVRHPLRAKKARDFDIWKSGVELAYAVKTRPRNRCPRGYGTLPKWASEERQRFRLICASLRSVRSYESAAVLEPDPTERQQDFLF